MRLVWVSFDVMGRDCLAAAAEAGAEVAAVVSLPGPIDPNRSGQCSFDEIAAELGARLIETADVNSPATIAALREVEPDLIFVGGRSGWRRRRRRGRSSGRRAAIRSSPAAREAWCWRRWRACRSRCWLAPGS